MDLNAVNVAMDGKSAQRAQAWVEKLRYVLSARGGEEYELVCQADSSPADYIPVGVAGGLSLGMLG